MTVVRRALTLLASAALSLALAAPATPSLASNASPSLGVLSRGYCGCSRRSGRRAREAGTWCGSRQPQSRPRQGRSQTVRDLPQAARGRAPSNFSVTVPVFWHVVTDGAAGSVTTCADPWPDQRHQPWLQRRRGRSGHRLHVLARRRDPQQQRRLVQFALSRRRARYEAGPEAGGDTPSTSIRRAAVPSSAMPTCRRSPTPPRPTSMAS